MNKKVLRSMFLEKRLTLSRGEYAVRNQRLFENCQQFLTQHSGIRHIHIFSSMSEKKEPDTSSLMDWLINKQKVNLYSSRTFYLERKLTHHQILHSKDFIRNKSGIPHPTNSNLVDPKTLDLVLIPLISFDESGNRIGYGAGLYDRFLSEVREDCLKVGLAITPPLNHIDYSDKYDVRLDYCINHLGEYKFQ